MTPVEAVYRVVDVEVSFQINRRKVMGHQIIRVPVHVEAAEAVREAGTVTKMLLQAAAPVVLAEVELQLLAPKEAT